MTSTLPIHVVLPDLLRHLRDAPNAVLVAPPGAGKTTAVAPALLDEPWCSGEILLLSPRRLAARAAAERMAATAGENVGQTFGYATRMDTKRSAATRVTVVTEGIFVARIQNDPELAGVSAVLFDEVHERSLDSDFGLALALDAQAALRPDLRLVAMSATLDGARFSGLMEGAPIIESAGRMHPLSLRHLGRAAEARIRIRSPPQSGWRCARKRAASSPSCPASPRSSAPPSGWRGSAPISCSTACMAASTPPHSAPRSRPTRKSGARSCWRHRSPRPA